MDLTKKRKITAIVTLSVMLVAIATTACFLFVPSTFKGDEDVVAPTATALNYKINKAEYTLQNASLAYLTFNSGSDKADLKVLFPNTIYIDNSENLYQTGYYFAYDVWVNSGNNYPNRALLWDNLFGYFHTSDSSVTVPSGNSATMLNVFREYGAEGRYLNGTDLGMGSADNYKDNGVESKNTKTEVEGRGVNNTITIPLKGYVKSDYQVTYNQDIKDENRPTFEHGCGKYQMAVAQWFDNRTFLGAPIGSNKWENMGAQAHFGDWGSGDAGSGIFHGISPFNDSSNLTEINKLYSNQYVDSKNEHNKTANDIKVNIYVYDKSELDKAVMRFESYLDILKTLNGNDNLYNAVKEYLGPRKKVLTDREVTQEQINTATAELNNYYLDIDVPTEEEQNVSTRTVTYNGQNRPNLGRFGTDSAKYFDIQYKKDGNVVASANTVGKYEVFVRPKATVATTYGDLKFRWNNDEKNNDYYKIGTYEITPANMAFQQGALKRKVTYPYVNEDYNVTVASALENETPLTDNLNNYYNSEANPLKVYTVVDVAGKDPATGINWAGVTAGNSVALKNAGNYTVYYKLTATNHVDITGSFPLEIEEADLSVQEGKVENKEYEFKNSAYSITLAQAIKNDNGSVVDDISKFFDNYYPQGNPMTIIYVLDSAEKDVEDIDWTGATSSVSIKDVGNYTVYYKASAKNHKDYASSFGVEITRANIELIIDVYEHTYGETVLTSKEIVSKMLTKTAKVFDAENWEGIKAYLEQICTFTVAITSSSTATTGKTYANVGKYTVSVSRNADWRDKIESITFKDNKNREAYQVIPKEIKINWTQQANMYYDGTGDKRPSASIISTADFVEGTTTGLNDVGISGNGIDFEGNEVELEKEEAISAGTYEAFVTCTNTNYTVDKKTEKFTILRRPITVELQERSRTYAGSTYENAKTATKAWEYFIEVVFPANEGERVYKASIDEALVKDGKGAIIGGVAYAPSVFEIILDQIDKDIYTADKDHESERYFKVNQDGYDLVLNLIDKNYELTSKSKNAKFKINPAKIDLDLQQVASRTYNGQERNIAITNNNTVIGLQGYEANHRDLVEIWYKDSENGTYSKTPLTMKNVGTKVIYYKVSAPNHATREDHFTAEITRNRITVTVSKTATATYGDAVPTSAELVDKLGITLSWINPNNRIEDIYDRLAFAISGVNDIMADAKTYSLTYKFINGEVANNFTITYANDGEDGKNVYTIKPKQLYVDWKQSGKSWADNGMQYSYDGNAPKIQPTAPDQYEGKPNVVVIDSAKRDNISLALTELKGSSVGSYTVTASWSTSQSSDRNSKNYIIANPNATFTIVKRIVEINIKNQTATYGNAKSVAFYSALLPENNGNSKWAYPSGADDLAKFVNEDYEAYHLTSIAHSAPDGQYMDVGGYPIEIQVRSGQENADIASNYDVRIVKEGAPADRQATFYITKAQIGFDVRSFNINYDDKDEKNCVTKAQMTKMISTAVGTPSKEFTVEMSDLFKKDDPEYGSINNVASANWVETTKEITDLADIGEYYVWVRVTHPKNYEQLEVKVQVNILSGWVSIKIGSTIEGGQYGDTVYTSSQLFNGLKENLTVFGGIKDGEQYKAFTLQDLEQYVTAGTIEFYVLNSDATPMTKNASFGNYTIDIRVVDATKEFKYFRFVDEDNKANAGKLTTNIGAYKVDKRTIGIKWGNMNEVYGSHTSTSASHTYEITNVVTHENGAKDEVRVEIKYERQLDNGQWLAVSHSNTLQVGNYRATVTEVKHPDYQLPEKLSEKQVEYKITEREITIDVSDRVGEYGLIYGRSANATRGGVEDFLNRPVAGFDLYKVADGSLDIASSDTASNVFRLKIGEYTLDSKYDYLFVGNYDILVESINSNYVVKVNKKGVLNIAESQDVGYAREYITPKVYIGKEFSVVEPLNNVFKYIELSGDGGDLLKDKDPKEIVQYKLEGDDESKYSPDYKIKDAGDYKVNIKVNAPNHKVTVFTVDLEVARAYVVINMKTAEKEYGDKENDLVAKDNDSNVKNISDWLKKHCAITITAYDEEGGNEITVEGINADFQFKVIDKGQVNGDALVIGENPVGAYRVYHKSDANLSKNYIINYYQDPSLPEDEEHKCNSDAYKIIPRGVDVIWVTDGYADGVKNKFIYNNSAPTVKATCVLLGDTEATVIPTVHVSRGSLSNKDRATAIDVGLYTAKIEFDSSEDDYAKLGNYKFRKDTFDFEIVAKKVTVIINNQTYTYGTNNTKVGVWANHTAYVREDGVAFPVGQPIELSIKEAEANKNKTYYSVGTYSIVGKCTSSNYEVKFKGKDADGKVTDNEFATFTVTEASMSVAESEYKTRYNGKAFKVDIKAIVKEQESYRLAGNMSWNDAIVTYMQEDGTYTNQMPVIDGVTGYEIYTVKYRVQLANHADYEGTMTIEILPARLFINIASGASSVYGDAVLTSDQLLAYATLDTNRSSIIVDLKSILTLKVTTSSGATVSSRPYRTTYNIGFTLKPECEGLYDVELIGEEGAYRVTARPLTVEWDYNGAFEYDRTAKEIGYRLVGVIGNDVVDIVDLTGDSHTDAGNYTARASRLNNLNYELTKVATLNWTINPKSVQVDWTKTATSATNFTYNGDIHTLDDPEIKAGQVIAGDDCEAVVEMSEKVNAGTHIATAKTTDRNYKISNDTFEYVIKRAVVSITWDNKALTYNGTEQAPTATVDAGQLIGEDTCKVIVSGAQKNAGKNYKATATLDNTNYEVSEADASYTFAIAPKAITFEWVEDTKTLAYTGGKQTPKATAVNAVQGDVVEFEVIVEEDKEGVNVGDYVATVVGVLANTNYVINESKQTNWSTDYTIIKGINEFTDLVKPDATVNKLPWSGNDKPHAKWGEVVVKYYSDEACTQEVTDIAKADEGKYWITITVVGTENYDEISETFAVELEYGLNLVIVIAGAVVSVALLIGALIVVINTNKKKNKQGGAV